MDASHSEEGFGCLAGEPTDYSDRSSWMHIPQAAHSADTLYFYPTCYADDSDDAPLVCSIDNRMMRESVHYMFMLQGSIFAESSNIFVPYYRQTNLAYYIAHHADGEKIFQFQRNEQRTDVFAAVDYYFKNYNDGRPYILAGHSQGSMMIGLILEEYMALHPEYYQRMIAAYMPGCSVTQKWLKAHPHLKFAQGETDTGCIISWNTEGPQNENEANFVLLPGALCINPLNWKLDDTYAHASKNLGGLGKSGIESHLTDAQINSKRGSVVVHVNRRDRNNLSDLFGRDSWHSMDYGFFFNNIKENARVRINAWFDR